MKQKSRREAVQMLACAAAWSGTTIEAEIEILPDRQIGVIRPELHGQFLATITSFSETAIEYLRVLAPPVVQGPVELAPLYQLIGAKPYLGGPALKVDPVTEDAILHQHRVGLVIETNSQTAVAAGLSINVFHRQADKIAVGLSPLQSLLLFDKKKCTPTGVYYAFLLAKPHRGNISVRANPPQANPLELSVSASHRDNSFVITMVNPKPDRNLRIRCLLNGRQVNSASATTLFEQKLDVQVRPEGMLLTLPALSVTSLFAQTT